MQKSVGEFDLPFITILFTIFPAVVFLLCHVLKSVNVSISSLSLSGYEEEKKKLLRFQNYCLAFGGVIYFGALVIETISFSITLPNIIELYDSYSRALACTVFMTTAAVFETSTIMFVVLILVLFGFLMRERFEHLSAELYLAEVNSCKDDIDNFIYKHTELYDLIGNLNDNFSIVFLVAYSGTVAVFATFLYNFVYKTVSPIYLTFYALILLIFFASFALCSIAFLVSRILVSAYDSFQEIRKFKINSFNLEDKLKVLDFMKRFGANSIIGFTCEDFFVITRKFPIELYNALYNAYNILLQMRDISQGTQGCKPLSNHISANMTTIAPN
ncbi:uncharacterized protein [Centruroides vittatus]|uniref:uncharacterized protein n=1 Tax=Centruroides vittatus TaxID=120091 RepID=UPI00350F5020